MRGALSRVLVGVVVALGVPTVQSASGAPTPLTEPAGVSAVPYIVTVKAGVEPLAVALAAGATATYRFDSALNGFAADLTSTQLRKVQRDARVVSMTADVATVQTRPGIDPYDGPQGPQFVTTGVRRVGGLQSATARIDGVDERVDADVAVLDSGVDAGHVDLNVAGGVDCTAGTGWADLDGHGTLVAGFIGALDNGIGAVGVAPGARIWAVRVAKPNGIISTSSLLCGLEWVVDRSSTIEIANLSLGMKGSDTGNCGAKRKGVGADVVHEAICRVVAGGVIVVAAAGNESADAGGSLPAAYPEVIAVSALTDTDGRTGGLGGPASCLAGYLDDRLALFSNFGAAVDIAAPGVCISSTFPGNRYATGSGTSFATPLVAGAAALYRSQHPAASPAMVRAAIIAASEAGPIAGDPDPYAEGVLDVSGF